MASSSDEHSSSDSNNIHGPFEHLNEGTLDIHHQLLDDLFTGTKIDHERVLFLIFEPF